MNRLEIFDGIENLDLNDVEFSNTTGSASEQKCRGLASMGVMNYEVCMAGEKASEQKAIEEQAKKLNIDPKEIAEIAKLAAEAGVAISSLLQKDPDQKALQNVCGRKPNNKKKREDWEKCALEFYRVNASKFNSGREGETFTPPPPPPKKMSTGTKVAIGLGVAAVLGLGIWLVVKKMRK